MQLKYPGFVQRRQLHDVRPFGELVLEERGPGFGIESPGAGVLEFPTRRVRVRGGRDEFDTVESETIERREQCDLFLVGCGLANLHGTRAG